MKELKRESVAIGTFLHCLGLRYQLYQHIHNVILVLVDF